MTMDSHTKGLKGSHIKVEKDMDSMIEEDDRDSWSRWTLMNEKKRIKRQEKETRNEKETQQQREGQEGSRKPTKVKQQKRVRRRIRNKQSEE